jgi:hypothetical protein
MHLSIQKLTMVWYAKSVPCINLEVQLNIIADSIILERELVLERPLSLSFEQYLMRRTTNVSTDDLLELADRIWRKAWYCMLRSQSVIDCDPNHRLLRYSWRSFLLPFLLPLSLLCLVVVTEFPACIVYPVFSISVASRRAWPSWWLISPGWSWSWSGLVVVSIAALVPWITVAPFVIVPSLVLPLETFVLPLSPLIVSVSAWRLASSTILSRCWVLLLLVSALVLCG